MCINAVAAERISFNMAKTAPWKAEHIDMWLLKWCQDFRLSEGCCSYVFPPIGCFGAHVSECCPEKGDRNHLWDEDYSCEGTRPSEDSKNRPKQVYGMTEGGKGHVDLQCTLTEEFFMESQDCGVHLLIYQKRHQQRHPSTLLIVLPGVTVLH